MISFLVLQYWQATPIGAPTQFGGFCLRYIHSQATVSVIGDHILCRVGVPRIVPGHMDAHV